MLVTCTSDHIDMTLRQLREAGQRRCECVTLWLARRSEHTLQVEAVYRPTQTAREDMFHIPPAGMTALYAELRQRRLMVAAQVHSHPQEAFHSKADDRWAIVRHERALSLVVPHFALNTTVSRFLDDTKVYQFSAGARWTEVPAAEVTQSWLQIS
jgi:proteasome lid subunit RPN8/RPN11